jgi:hypothetical protein
MCSVAVGEDEEMPIFAVLVRGGGDDAEDRRAAVGLECDWVAHFCSVPCGRKIV